MDLPNISSATKIAETVKAVQDDLKAQELAKKIQNFTLFGLGALAAVVAIKVLSKKR